MSRSTIILVTIAAWAVGCACAAYVKIEAIASRPDLYPGYESDRGFLLLVFCIFQLPFWLVGLLAVVSLEVVVLKPSHRKLR